MTRRAALGSIDDAPGPGDGVRGAEVEGRGDAIGANTDHPGPGDGVRGAGIGGSGDALGRNTTLVFAVLERPTYQSAGEQCAAVQDLRCSVE